MKQYIKTFFTNLLDLIYKKKCYFCHLSKHSEKMCQECFNTLSLADFKTNRIINGVNIYSAGIYEKNLQKLIRGLKFHKQRELAYYLAKFMWEYFKELDIKENYQVIPVPMHKNRRKKRGYNHMELVAEEFCKLSGFISNFELITRIKDTKPQYKLSKVKRMENLSDAFKINNDKLLDLPILIIDDICTTGSTFEEMIKELKNAGCKEIICLSASNP